MAQSDDALSMASLGPHVHSPLSLLHLRRRRRGNWARNQNCAPWHIEKALGGRTPQPVGGGVGFPPTSRVLDIFFWIVEKSQIFFKDK